jgi:hypothetical protein
MNKILRSKNPIILLLVILLSGVSLSNVATAASTDSSATFTVDGVAAVDADTINKPFGTTSVTVVVTEAAGATSVVSGDTGLTTGSNTVTVVVTAEDGLDVTTTTFTVIVAAASTDSSAPAPASFTPSTPQTALVLTTSATTVGWGSQVKLTLTGGSGTGAVTYSSTGTTLCAVDSNGVLIPVSAGTCTVTANKAADGTYGSAQSNSITITATDAPATTTTTSAAPAANVVVGRPVAGITTIRFAIADSYAGNATRVVLVTKNSAGRSIYRILGNATVSATGAVTFRSKVRIPAKAILQLRSAGSVIFSKMVN